MNENSNPDALEPSSDFEDDFDAEIEALCDDFLTLREQGLATSVEAFADQHPHLRDDLLELLPTILLLNTAGTQNRIKRKDGMVVRGPESFDRLGDYLIRGELGRGGMGIVFDAYQPSLDREVAIKVLPRQLDDQEHKDRFLAEARICARLHHSNIAPVYTVGEDQGVYFYAMEKLKGVPLDRFVQQVQKRKSQTLETNLFNTVAPELSLTIDDVVDIGIQVSDALEYAHQNGVTHRDIKPANLIRGENGRVWLTDFGLATKVDDDLSTSSSGISGTLRYVAPERIDGAVDAPTGDVYSLGVTLMELLTGKAAFSAHRRRELLEQIRNNEYTPLASEQKIGEDLIAVLTKAASLDPNERYQSASSLKNDLVRFSQGESVKANPLGPIATAWRWYQRNRAIATLSLITVASLFVAAIVSTVFYLYSENQLTQEQVLRSEAMNASKVANEAIDEIFHQLNVGTGLAGIDSPDYNVAEADRNTHLLNQLTRFYEQLAARESGTNFSFDPVYARRKVGQLRMRVGEYDKAILDFSAAQTRLVSRINSGVRQQDTNTVLLQAQLYNEKGLAKRILDRQEQAQSSHMKALDLLKEWSKTLPTATDAPHLTSRQNLDFEIARTLYFLAFRTRPGMGPKSYPPMPPYSRAEPEPRPDDLESRAYVQQAIASLKRNLPDHIVLSEFDDSTKLPSIDFRATGRLADTLHLLALCYRESAHDNQVLWTKEDEKHHNRSIALMKLLTLSFPTNTTYRFDLMRAYAEMDVLGAPVGGKHMQSNMEMLQNAIELGETLVDRYPNVTDFQSELSHAYNKLGTLLERQKMRATTEDANALDIEIERAYRRAYQHQLALIKINSRSPAYKVWAALFAIRCAQTNTCRKNPDRRNRFVARANSLLKQLPEPVQQRRVVQDLLETSSRLSLLGVADPPAVDQNDDLP